MKGLIIDPKVVAFYRILDKGFVNRILETVNEQALLLYLQRGLEQNGSVNIHEKFDVDSRCRTTSDTRKGGFTWRNTIEGQDFWNKVLNADRYIQENKSDRLFFSTAVFEIKYPHPILTEVEEYGQD